MPVVTGPTSPAATATMTSSSFAVPAVVSPQGEQRLPVAEGAEGAQVGVPEPVADADRPHRHVAGAGGVARPERLEHRRDEQVAGRRAVGDAAVLEWSSGRG